MSAETGESENDLPPPPAELLEANGSHQRYDNQAYDEEIMDAAPDDVDVSSVTDEKHEEEKEKKEEEDEEEEEKVKSENGSDGESVGSREETMTQITTLTSRDSTKNLRVTFRERDEDEIIGYSDGPDDSLQDSEEFSNKRSSNGRSALRKLGRALVCYKPDPKEEQMYLKPYTEMAGPPTPVPDHKVIANVDGINLTTLAGVSTEIDMAEEERRARRETLFFVSDDDEKQRRIDYVLAYDDEDEKLEEKRKLFTDNLSQEGICIQVEPKENSVNQRTIFLKLHAPVDVLFHNADLLNMRKRIKTHKVKPDSEVCICSCCHPCSAGADIVPEEDDFFTAPFNKYNKEMFDIDPEDEAAFFTNSERSLIVKEILDRTAYTPPEATERKFGIHSLLSQGVFTAAFPLHEGQLKPTPGENDAFNKDNKDRDRMRLFEAWAKFGRWYCFQPLDLIRKYFGEKIAIYFAWLGFYTGMLIPAALLGLVAFLYGCITIFDNVPSEDICGALNGTLMCPQCDRDCFFWTLSTSCFYSRITYVFDNYATVAFACFMAIWSTVFLELWTRQQNTIQYEWDVAEFELIERMRPEFEFKVKKTRRNPITDANEPYMSLLEQIPRACTSFTVILLMIVLLVGAIVGVIIYRFVMVTVFYVIDDPSWVGSNATLVTSITAALINFVVIMIFSVVYRMVAFALTNLEAHRTYTDYEDSFTFKMFLFQFVNFYGTIFYIAFFKGRFLAHPGSTKFVIFGGYKQDNCDPAGCLVELTIQLFIIMVGKQTLNNVKELLLPGLKNWFRAKKQKASETEENMYMRWEQDNDLQPLTNLALFDEYLEMVIQFGFVTIFVAAFPLAPLFALINNIIEIRLDAYKFLVQYQRLPANRAQDIGAWYSILQTLSFIAIISNAAILAWTSEFIPKLVYIHLFNENATSLDGYVDNSLSIFLVGDYPEQIRPLEVDNNDDIHNYTLCRYRGFRNGPFEENKYEYSTEHWQVLCARLAFMLVFEHVCFFCAWFVAYIIPDVPSDIKQLMLYEKQLVRQLTFDASQKKRHTDGHTEITCRQCGAAT